MRGGRLEVFSGQGLEEKRGDVDRKEKMRRGERAAGISSSAALDSSDRGEGGIMLGDKSEPERSPVSLCDFFCGGLGAQAGLQWNHVTKLAIPSVVLDLWLHDVSAQAAHPVASEQGEERHQVNTDGSK
ncbi:hypothetical protein EYF80_003094 [Liparis tanakae]|uniref:Uncharacterized protein n=1 Tax=Liparis tanakae TaxID=230148 RepID=A0A4Z2J8S8_9TELE|nr:hypothetical protein EYF80_003094 [Liparis tanakae]